MSDMLARITTWFGSRDTGRSSEAIAVHMTGGKVVDGDGPRDAADLGRCLRLLALFPAWQSRIGEMASYGPDWAGLVAVWPSIVASMEREVGIDWSKGCSAPDTYHLMQLAIADGYRNAPAYRCTFSERGHLQTAIGRDRE